MLMQTSDEMKAMRKPRIGGIKLSAKLVQLTISDQDGFTPSVLPLFRTLRENKINMPFISTALSKGNQLFTCCISSADIKCVKDFVAVTDVLNGKVVFVSDVGLLSVYPHRSSFKLLGLSLCGLADAGIQVLGMASSVSSLTFVIKHAMFNKAVSALMNYLDIPEGYIPLIPDDL